MKLKISLMALAVLSVAACNNNMSSKGSHEVWQNYGESKISSSQLADNQALAVFYRDEQVAHPVNLYINNDYQGSLLNQSFTEMALCAAPTLLSTSYTTNQHFGNRTEGIVQELPAQSINYFKVSVIGTDVQIESVSEEVAKQDMAGLRKATHTLSRVNANKCEAPVTTKTLSAAALFGTNQSSYQSISAQGKAEIKAFAESVRNSGIKRLTVSGYTDPMGSDAYNLALSQQRANAVAQGLKAAGVTAPIEAVGYGKAKLVVKCDTQTTKKALVECNTPNRRVEISAFH